MWIWNHKNGDLKPQSTNITLDLIGEIIDLSNVRHFSITNGVFGWIWVNQLDNWQSELWFPPCIYQKKHGKKKQPSKNLKHLSFLFPIDECIYQLIYQSADVSIFIVILYISQKLPNSSHSPATDWSVHPLSASATPLPPQLSPQRPWRSRPVSLQQHRSRSRCPAGPPMCQKWDHPTIFLKG